MLQQTTMKHKTPPKGTVGQKYVSEEYTPATPHPGVCSRAGGSLIAHPYITCSYRASESMIHVSGLGTMIRTGLCPLCDAAIYRVQSPGERKTPENPKLYHAVQGGLRDLRPATNMKTNNEPKGKIP